jgi:dihydrofolate reductase
MELSVNEFVSLDGVMQGPGGADEDRSNGFKAGGWLVPHAAEGQLAPVDSWFGEADAILLGRSTFEMMRTYWSQVTVEPDNIVSTALNTWKKYVVSNTLSDEDAAWGDTTVLRGDGIIEQVRRLKDLPGRELQVHGSWQLVRALHDAGLVDTYRLIQFPVVVGMGKRLFETGAVPSTYKITSGEMLDGGSGVVSLTLRQTGFGSVTTGDFAVEDGQEVIV